MTNKQVLRVLSFCMAVVLPCLAQAGGDSPASAYQPNEPAGYGPTFPAEANSGDLDFRIDLRLARDLTPTEKFMLAGGTNRSTGKAAQPWVHSILMFCHAYHHRNGRAPQQITPEVISACISGLTVQEAAAKQLFKNPFTGAWPRCDSLSPSAGDLYCRPLSASEVQHMAKYDGTLGLVLEGKSPGGSGTAKLEGQVWYYRVYGESGRVIYAALHYNWI